MHHGKAEMPIVCMRVCVGCVSVCRGVGVCRGVCRVCGCRVCVGCVGVCRGVCRVYECV